MNHEPLTLNHNLLVPVVPVDAAVVRWGQKNKPTSLGLYPKKPYIDAGDPRVKIIGVVTSLVGERLRERERERE
jgi:hypothetical protein